MLLSAALALAPLAALQASPDLGVVTGTVQYRERMALPGGAELSVSLVQVAGRSRVALASTHHKLGRRQVPLPFSLSYRKDTLVKGASYGLAAVIHRDGQPLWETLQPVLLKGDWSRPQSLMLTRAPRTPGVAVEGMTDRIWELAALDGRPIQSRRTPSLFLSGDKGTLNGMTGVNSFGGTWTTTGPFVQLDPGPMTMMAGSEEEMAVESRYLDILRTANRMALQGDRLILYRGRTELARFSPKSSR